MSADSKLWHVVIQINDRREESSMGEVAKLVDSLLFDEDFDRDWSKLCADVDVIAINQILPEE